MGFHSLLQEIFQTQRLNLGLLHWQVDALLLSYLEVNLLIGKSKTEDR